MKHNLVICRFSGPRYMILNVFALCLHELKKKTQKKKTKEKQTPKIYGQTAS